MDETGQFFTVETDIYHLRLPDPLEHGYECERDFRRALRALSERWKGRAGECVGERHGFLLLRFHDTPGGRPDEAWLPRYLLKGTDPPEWYYDEEPDELEAEIDRAYGFD